MTTHWQCGHSGQSGQGGSFHSAHSAQPAKDDRDTGAGTVGCISPNCLETVTADVANQLATLRPAVRAAVCVEALRRALKMAPPPATSRGPR